MPGIAEFSGHWEGRAVDGYSLGRFLGGSERSLVYLTSFESRPAAIKLLQVAADQAEAQLGRWAAAARLSHLNLIRIFTSGRARLDDIALLYVVMECAEENLGQVLPERVLTEVEAREMLDPALSALDYIHRKGFIHAHLKPSNIMAVDDRLKLSSDDLRRTGETSIAEGPYDAPERVLSPSSDAWSLGAILVAAFGLSAPDLPAPFADIATHCLERNPSDRWTIPQIVDHLSHPEGVVAAPRRRRLAAPVGVIMLVGVVILVAAGVMLRRSAPQPPPAAPAVAQQEPPPPVKTEERKSRKRPVAVSVSSDQPMPEILPEATRSIRGKVIVTITVDADASGAVTSATASAGSSKYFSAQAVKAVRRWKFEAGDAPQHWQIRFEFLPGGTKVSKQRLP